MDFNGNQVDKMFQKPKVIYRRLSMARYRSPNRKYSGSKSKYGPPRPKSRPHKAGRKPGKKARRTSKPKTTSMRYGPPGPKHSTHSTLNRGSPIKPKYGVPKYRPNGRPGYGHIVKMPHYSFFKPDKSGFGEPPAPNVLEYQNHKQSYGEPPVDSYGAPLQHSIKDDFATSHSFMDSSPHNEIQDYNNQEQQWNHKYTTNSDSNYAFTNKEPTYSSNVAPTAVDINIDTLDPVSIEEQKKQENKISFRRRRPTYLADSKFVNRPWKPNKHNDFDDEIIVGGQYAEPPARFVPNIHQNSPMYDDDEDEDAFPAVRGYRDTDNLVSANSSPYVNYKHSNMAFSPQNLNDAFSIVDK